jgi:hypothetical protein
MFCGPTSVTYFDKTSSNTDHLVKHVDVGD